MNKLKVEVTMTFPLGEVPTKDLSHILLEKKINQYVLEALMREPSYIKGLIDLQVKSGTFLG